jgi:hypothetical protein
MSNSSAGLPVDIEALVRWRGPSDKKPWSPFFALPPRCAGCGTIVGDVHSFCPTCWQQVEFLGESGCSTCGLPLRVTEQTSCGVCLAKPPRIARTRAAVAYDELSRSLAIRLKYGRKVAIARTMARYMAPLVIGEGDRLLVPVPLHRTRLWSRGFTSPRWSRASFRGGSEWQPTRWRFAALGVLLRSRARVRCSAAGSSPALFA